MSQPKKGTRAGAVRFQPERAIRALELNSLDHISESMAFWSSRLAQVYCPDCGIKGTLGCEILPYGVEIACGRRESDRCGYAQEVVWAEAEGHL